MDSTYADPTRAAYDSFAPFYDLYTHDFEYRPWLRNIEAAAVRHGLRGSRVLDVGCGTGKSFLPLLELGYEVTACDLSEGMLARAQEVAGDAVVLHVADMRELPTLGRFDFVTCICDALNYMLTDDDLAAAFEGVARNLRPGGLFAFDLVTIGRFRASLSCDTAWEVENAFFCSRQPTESGVMEPGGTFTAVVEVFATDDGECWRRHSTLHAQRHHPPELVEHLLDEAGMELVAVYGQRRGGRLELPADEDAHIKVDYFARRRATTARGYPGGGA